MHGTGLFPEPLKGRPHRLLIRRDPLTGIDGLLGLETEIVSFDPMHLSSSDSHGPPRRELECKSDATRVSMKGAGNRTGKRLGAKGLQISVELFAVPERDPQTCVPWRKLSAVAAFGAENRHRKRILGVRRTFRRRTGRCVAQFRPFAR